ncbi:hypothetical protein ACJ41O_001612 [Fusarium nematophilum]
MAFTQEPIPEVLTERVLPQYGPNPAFRHREVIRQWVENIFTKNGNDRLVEFNTSVELAEKSGDEWVLTLRKDVPGESTNYWWQERFDALIVASGHYHLPYIPDIPGLAEYDERLPGRIKHTKHFDTAQEFAGKRVIVVGGSVSAFDALHDVRQTAKLPVISSLREPSAIFGWAAFQHPDIDNRSSISSVDPDTGRITFHDGTSVNNIDAVLFATGFEFSFPFLPHAKQVNRRIPGLYQHVFKSSDPSLAFIGMVTGGFGLRIFEWQAVAVARYLSGRATLPSRKEMEDWEQRRVSEKGDGTPFWVLLPDFENHFEALRAIAGDPAPGSTGRVLPKYDEKWGETFWQLINDRIAWWKQEAARAETIIEYYFSFISLWSYIGSRRLQALAQQHDAEIIYKPIDLLRIFSISGGLPVKQRSVQRQAYRLVEMERWTKLRGLPIVQHPKFYPADPSLAHRVLLAAIEELGYRDTAVQEFARRGLETVWANESDIADPATIVEVANSSGLEGGRLLERAKKEEKLAQQEESLTEEAVSRKLFGAPFYFYQGEPFWGQDRLEMLDEVIKSGREPIPVPTEGIFEN